MNSYMDIIPTPKKCTYTCGSKLCVASACVVGDISDIIQSGLDILDKEGIARVDLPEEADFVVYSDFDKLPANIFDDDELGIFNEKYASDQGYVMKRIDNSRIIAAAQGHQGCAYAMVTLLQIIGKEVGSFVICDVPDIGIRGIKWTVWAECGGWGYDFGDGAENLKKRLERKIELAFRYKINLIYADGYGFDTERFPGYAEIMKYLCDQARKKGIKIMSGGYTMAYGLADHKDAYQGKVFLNRKHYPDGEVYECLGRHMAHTPEITGRTRGTCLSNDELFEQKIDEIVNFVRETHIGCVTLHNMDSHEIHPEYWMARCDECRKRWPNDSLYEKDGAAGAFAEFIDKIMERLREVKDGDYDASRDLIVRMAAPGYLYAVHTPDDVFEMGVRFWRSVTEYMKNPENFGVGFREQFFYHDKNERRLDFISENIGKAMTGIGLFNGCDGAYSDKLFTVSSALNYMQKGADIVTCYNGNIFHEPLILYNAEYLWNSENSGFYNVSPKPENYDEFMALYNSMLAGQFRPDAVYGEGGFLDIICQKLYGGEVGLKMAKVYKLCGENGESPVPCAAWKDIHTNYGATGYPMSWHNILKDEEIDAYRRGFYQSNKVTEQAYGIIDAAVSGISENTDMKSELAVLRECFYMGKMLTKLLYDYMVIFGEVNLYLNDAKASDSQLNEKFSLLQDKVNKLKDYVNTYEVYPVDKFGGIFINRKNMAEFFEENIAAMRLSIKLQKRIADENMQVNIKEWDA